MPWQQHVADVALEIDPADGGLWYRGIDLAVPRQSGKTTWILPWFVWRAEASHLLGGRQRMLYTAQTGKDAGEKFDEDYVEDLAAARVMRGRYRARNHAGRKSVRFQSGSLLSPVAPTGTVGHGKTLDAGALDEAWAQKDARVEDGWRPAMITRRNAQLLRTSTAGESQAESPYWYDTVHRGRLIVEAADPSSRLAYFEWGADPDDDPESPATWWKCMPALGFTQTEAAVRHELENISGGLPAFQRAFLNVWAEDKTRRQPLPAENWKNCCDKDSKRNPDQRPVLAIDVRPDRSRSAVAMASVRPDGLPMAQVIHYADGTSWVAKYVADAVRDKGAYAVVWDTVGPANSLGVDLAEELDGTRDVVLHGMNTTEVTDACQQMFDAVVTEQFRHVGQKEVDEAVKGLRKRELPGGRFAWNRVTSDVDISPIVAMTDAAWALRNLDPPQAFFGGNWR